MQGFDTRVPLDDIAELDRQLRGRDVAAFVIETVQGKGCQTRSQISLFVPRNFAANTERC
jgi:Ornithine/acetylornithine aminotransferase